MNTDILRGNPSQVKKPYAPMMRTAIVDAALCQIGYTTAPHNIRGVSCARAIQPIGAFTVKRSA